MRSKDNVLSAADNEPCCVCLHLKQRPMCSPDCMHAMCARCSARHIWQSRDSGTVCCPLCRGRIKQLIPAEDIKAYGPPRIISLEFAGVSWEILLKQGEKVESCLLRIFEIPKNRMKLIGKGGRVVDSYESIVNVRETRPFRLVGTPQISQLARFNYYEIVQSYALSAFEIVFFLLEKIFALVVLFFSSMIPGKNHKAEQASARRSRERERHRAQNGSME